jgi:GNAT superfamily N-acetyltransferase/uncharacterized protein YndB with AHSA1/START domain
MPLRLRPFAADLAGTVSGWATSDDEALIWCGRAGAPVPAEAIAGWAEEPGVRPFGLHSDDRLIAYGELWVDHDEVELARIIVDPGERGHGIGRRLVTELAAVALGHRPQVFMRVHPSNAAALRCYGAAGFVPVDPELAARWNRPQPVAYEWLTLGPQRITARRDIAAPASAIFELVSDPEGHVRLDGSGMLVAAGTRARLSAVGDAFEMEMDREPLGDLPMGRYRTRNVVTRLEPDRRLEWAVGSPDGRLLGHVYGYELTPIDGGTAVSSYCDWSAVPPAAKARTRWPVVPLDRLERTLANLEALLAPPPADTQRHPTNAL